MEMTDAESEEWAEELLKLVEEEDQRADKKLNQMRPAQDHGPTLPSSIGIQDARSLLHMHAGNQPKFPM